MFPACGLSAVFCLACAACLPFGRRRLYFRLAGSLPLLCKLLRPLPCLPAVRFVCAVPSCFGCLFARSVLCARLFSLIFRLFLPDFFLSNLFSLVAQAATGPSSLVPSRGFVPGLRAAYLFLPDPCCRNLPAVRFVCAVLFCFGCLFACSSLFARAFFSYLSPFPVWLFASQTSFHLSLMPRRGFSCLFLSATLFPACGPLTSFCPTRAAGTCPPCALCAQFCFVSAVCLPVLRCLHAHFSLIFRLFLFGFLPLKLLFICRSCRDGHPIFFSERKWGKRTARGAARRSPSNPIPAPCGQSPLFSRCWPA